MKIIILGAGQVGSTLATNLASENNDVTLIDNVPERLQALDEKLQIRTLLGNAAHPSILERAGIKDADMLIAVTRSDETNMLACQISSALFHVPTKIARVRNAEYIHCPDLFNSHAINVDVLISPETLITNTVKRLIDYPGTLQVLDFAGGRVQLVVLKALEGAPLVGETLSTLKVHMPSIETQITTIIRANKAITPTPNTIIEANDEISFIAASNSIREIISEFRGPHIPYKRILIAGGGHIGSRLAQALESHYHVKIIEKNPERAHVLAERLDNTVVLTGDVSDRDLLFNENIQDIDLFCAMTDNDETNIMSGTLAKRMGARKVIALINRTAYIDLIEGGDVDVAVSPSQATISGFLHFLRKGDILQAYPLRRGNAEAIEAVAHGTKETSHVVGRFVRDLKLPAGILIGAIVRHQEVFTHVDDCEIQAEDHLILFVQNRKNSPHVEKLFQVGFDFF